MTTDDAWLRALQATIWRDSKASWRGSTPATRGPWSTYEARLLTTEELVRVLALARSGEYVVTMRNACMGFGVGMGLWRGPSYPGVEPTHLLTVTNEHLPSGSDREHASFEEAWPVFSPIALSSLNQGRHAFVFGQRLPTNQSHYDY